MKRTLLAIVMAGSGATLFAQTTPTTPTQPTSPTTTQPTTTSPTSTSPTSTTNPAMTSPSNTYPSTTAPTGTYPANSSTTNPVNANQNSSLNGTLPANGSASWAPGTSPYWGWNSYGIWNNGSNVNTNVNSTSNPNTSVNASTDLQGTGNNTMHTDAATNTDLNSAGSYQAYSGTAVTALPYHVQQNFGKDFPSTMGNQYSWNQYGDWFSTQYTSNGRLMQYFYDERGRGYALSLPVIQTYVPEDVVDKALQKYGSHLYSIGTIKTGEGKSAYQIGLLDRGQLHNEYLNEDGSAVAGVWRVEELTSTTENAAMDGATAEPVTNETMAYQDTTMKKHKMKTHNSDGTRTKTKMKGNKMKTKTRTDSTSNGMKPEEQQ